MRAYLLHGPALDRLEATILPDPEPRRGEALVRLRAASLNFLDAAVITGRYPGAQFPLVPMADGAGEVVAVGPEVTAVTPGDRVAIHPKALWVAGRQTAASAAAMRGVTLPGALREYAAVDAATLVRAPDALSFEEAAALPIAATTAWNALVCGGVGPGHTVVLEGTGGVAIFALQLAKARGARVIITSSDDGKLARAKALGADHGINYRRTPDWEKPVLDLTDGRGADLVLEAAGAETFPHAIAATRHAGTIYSIGFLSGTEVTLNLLSIIEKALRVQGGNTGSVQDLGDAVAALGAHGLKPVIDRTFGLDALADAYGAVLNGGAFGKFALSLDWPAA